MDVASCRLLVKARWNLVIKKVFPQTAYAKFVELASSRRGGPAINSRVQPKHTPKSSERLTLHSQSNLNYLIKYWVFEILFSLSSLLDIELRLFAVWRSERRKFCCFCFVLCTRRCNVSCWRTDFRSNGKWFEMRLMNLFQKKLFENSMSIQPATNVHSFVPRVLWFCFQLFPIHEHVICNRLIETLNGPQQRMFSVEMMCWEMFSTPGFCFRPNALYRETCNISPNSTPHSFLIERAELCLKAEIIVWRLNDTNNESTCFEILCCTYYDSLGISEEDNKLFTSLHHRRRVFSDSLRVVSQTSSYSWCLSRSSVHEAVTLLKRWILRDFLLEFICSYSTTIDRWDLINISSL